MTDLILKETEELTNLGPFFFRLNRTAIGIRVKDGVVLAVEKLVQSKLLVPGANRRIQNVDRHIGIVRKQIICL